MVRRKFDKKMYDWLNEYAKDYTSKELTEIINDKFNETFNNQETRRYLARHNIKYKANKNKQRNMGERIPVGTEYIKPDGMTLIKVKKDKWEYKQRKIYQEYYNVKLPKDVYVIFLDGDKTNFDIKNLKAVNRKYCSGLANYRMPRTKEITETILAISKLNQKIKQKNA